jgi:serine/threonine protein kinase
MEKKSGSDLAAYAIIDRLAVGGAAELFRARHKTTGQLVVIKRLRTDLAFDPVVSAGFFREVQLAMRSEHKNLIEGYDRGSHEGIDWVAVGYVDGRDLAMLLERLRTRQERMEPGMALYIAREILEGLAFAYNIADFSGGPMGLVHRDLNPRNVLVGYDGGVHVADFGASVASLTEPVPDEVVGSPGYLSPEQARLLPIDARSDIFSLGCMLYEMVTGELAFDVGKKSEAQLLRLHQRGQIRRCPRFIAEPLRLLIEIACAPDREDRFHSATHMRGAVEAALADVGAGDLQERMSELLRTLFAAEYAARTV